MDSTDGNISADSVAKLSAPLFAPFFLPSPFSFFLSFFLFIRRFLRPGPGTLSFFYPYPLSNGYTRSYADTIVLLTFFDVSSLHALRSGHRNWFVGPETTTKCKRNADDDEDCCTACKRKMLLFNWVFFGGTEEREVRNTR